MLPRTVQIYLQPLVFLLACYPLKEVWGHGRLIEPPSRASAWRYGFNTPPDYNDHEIYCGGFHRQWHRNSGKCGICGDAWDLPQPRPHEAGGTWGRGVIVRHYPSGGLITVRVELTASHLGHFEFRVCPAPGGVATQQCLDKHLLRRAISRRISHITADTKFFPQEGNKIYEMRYRLPDLSCSHCVLQWIYIAGNNWGLCPNGSQAVGCGPQEEFRACADISIGDVTDTTTPEFIQEPPEDNEIPIDEVKANLQPRYIAVTISVVLGGLILVILLLAAIYIRYYHSSIALKNCLKAGRKEKSFSRPKGIPPPPQCEAPAPPPRTRRPHNNESLA